MMSRASRFLVRSFRAHRVPFLVLLLIIGGPIGLVIAEYCWNYTDLNPASNPKPWECVYAPPSGAPAADPATQMFIDEHANWHCVNGHIDTAPGLGTGPAFGEAGYGRQFLAFHKQIIYDFDLFRESVGLGRLEVWDPNAYDVADPDYNPMPYGIPGPDVSYAAAISLMAIGSCGSGDGRAANTRCPECDLLYTQFRVAPVGTLNSFTSADDLGDELDSGWHGAFHSDISAAADSDGNSCQDICCSDTSPRDAMFWRAHHALDEVHVAWKRLQATDIMIVLDRSGSMSAPAGTGDPETKLDAAKAAATMFADLLEDTGGHTLGLVPFSSGVDPGLGLTAAGPSLATTVSSTMAPITPGGSTSIAAGLLDAQGTLDAGSNDRKAILLLTDGKENTPPCIEGTGFLCLGPGGIPQDSFGDTHICAIGYGEEADLDGLMLRDLAERQGGIYARAPTDDPSASGTVALAKFFVDCFADIFDASVAFDPVGTLPAGSNATQPIRVPVGLTSEATFVLGWEEAEDPLRLLVRTPSGVQVDSGAAGIEFSQGATWQIMRVPLPYGGESDGPWQVQALREKVSRTPQGYFIDVLTPGPGRLQPTVDQFHHYTSEPLLAVARLPAPYRPMDEFDRVRATVTVTRPVTGTGNLLAASGLGQADERQGDPVDGRTVSLMALRTGDAPLTATTTQTYELHDDGEDGDQFAHNNYWSAIVSDEAPVEGHYQLHFVFELTEGGTTIRREASHSVFVQPKLDPDATRSTVAPMPPGTDGRERLQYTFRPVDSIGNLLGPGRADWVDVGLTGDARLESDVQDLGNGTYTVVVTWPANALEPQLTLSQHGQLRQTVSLPDGSVTPAKPIRPDEIPHGHADAPAPRPQITVERRISEVRPMAGETVEVTVIPHHLRSFVYTANEDVGGLEYTGTHSAQDNPEGTTFVVHRPVPFRYSVSVPKDARPGDEFVIGGTMRPGSPGVPGVSTDPVSLVVAQGQDAEAEEGGDGRVPFPGALGVAATMAVSLALLRRPGRKTS